MDHTGVLDPMNKWVLQKVTHVSNKSNGNISRYENQGHVKGRTRKGRTSPHEHIGKVHGYRDINKKSRKQQRGRHQEKNNT